MKLTNPGNIDRGAQLASRGSVYFRRGRGGQIIGQGWPKRRGKPKSALQQAWVDDFTRSAQRSKDPDPMAFCIAVPWTKGTGFYPRDLLEYADHGKFVSFSNREPNPLYGEVGKFQGKFRVLTPTACVYRTAAVNIVGTADVAMAANAKYWDNNVFWDAAHPTRLTAKVAGLYMIGLNIEWSQLNGSWRKAHIRLNGATILADQTVDSGINTPVTIASTVIWPFNVNDYVEPICQKGSTADLTCLLRRFWILAITPETLV